MERKPCQFGRSTGGSRFVLVKTTKYKGNPSTNFPITPENGDSSVAVRYLSRTGQDCFLPWPKSTEKYNKSLRGGRTIWIDTYDTSSTFFLAQRKQPNNFTNSTSRRVKSAFLDCWRVSSPSSPASPTRYQHFLPRGANDSAAVTQHMHTHTPSLARAETSPGFCSQRAAASTPMSATENYTAPSMLNRAASKEAYHARNDTNNVLSTTARTNDLMMPGGGSMTQNENSRRRVWPPVDQWHELSLAVEQVQPLRRLLVPEHPPP